MSEIVELKFFNLVCKRVFCKWVWPDVPKRGMASQFSYLRADTAPSESESESAMVTASTMRPAKLRGWKRCRVAAWALTLGMIAHMR